ncbi:uncharacterized protein LOC136074196 [Hydra vulgaris]|uniref:Uncharacterized protein LOC136074196 n=1 Tax=Hydra vulgaris TaxID=6087 RepID=A0ABM4B1D1_HYDVU
MVNKSNVTNLLEIFNKQNTLLLNNDNDPDVNFFEDVIINSNYFDIEEVSNLMNASQMLFSTLTLNIRSMNKNFESFKSMLKNINSEFTVICLIETWCRNEKNNFQIPGYKAIHQTRGGGIGGGVCIFVHDSIHFQKIEILSTQNTDFEFLTIELLNHNNQKNILITALYRPPCGNKKSFLKHLKCYLKKIKHKQIYITGDYNLNLLNVKTDSDVKRFSNTLFQYNIIPLINKPTRVTLQTESLIDNIFTNNFTTCNIQSGIIKSDISDHFPIFFISDFFKKGKKCKVQREVKRQVNETNIEAFRNYLLKVNWKQLNNCKDVNIAYDFFYNEFINVYNKAFPMKEIKTKLKNLQSPWITKGLIKSSKKKQRLYEKFLKNKTYQNEKKYKIYKNLFENLKKKAKKNYFSKSLQNNIGNNKKTWDIIKEVIGKNKQDHGNTLPKYIYTEDERTVINERKVIAESFNNYFINVGQNLANKITPGNKNFKSYIKEEDCVMDELEVSPDELRFAFNMLKPNKSSGLDDISPRVVKEVFDIIEKPLLIIFNLSFNNDILVFSCSTLRLNIFDIIISRG